MMKIIRLYNNNYTFSLTCSPESSPLVSPLASSTLYHLSGRSSYVFGNICGQVLSSLYHIFRHSFSHWWIRSTGSTTKYGFKISQNITMIGIKSIVSSKIISKLRKILPLFPLNPHAHRKFDYRWFSTESSSQLRLSFFICVRWTYSFGDHNDRWLFDLVNFDHAIRSSKFKQGWLYKYFCEREISTNLL